MSARLSITFPESRLFARIVLCLAALVCSTADAALAQSAPEPPRPRIVAPIDNARTIVLRGNTHPLARSEFDLGPAPDDQPMSRMMLVLRRSEQQQAALDDLLHSQQDPSSPLFHQWLSPAEFGDRFGPAPQDVAAVTRWLQAQGFRDIHLDRGHRVVEFSGDAGLAARAFRTAIHHFSVQGTVYSANVTDPQIPEALAPVVAGIVTLHNFPRQMHSRIAGVFQRDAVSGQVTPAAQQRPGSDAGSQTGPHPQYTLTHNNQTLYALGPSDFATIYNVLPLWTQATPIDGSGQTIAIVGETDINPKDFVSFRSLFGLPLGDTSGPTGTQYLNIIHNGVAPGVTYVDEETEADLDTQWSAAVARGATIDFVVSASTDTAQGIDLSAEYIIDNNLAPVMSTSYGACELALGTAGNAFYDTLYQQAAAQGITVLTSSGDSGSAGCDASNNRYSSYGLAVSGLNSTPYNVSVGGTDFYMPGNGSTYWNATSDPTTGASAKSYIPEIPWNDGCANPVLGSTSAFSGMTPNQVCNDVYSWNYFLSVAGGGGGRSSCTQSDGSTLASCTTPYPKPAWQAGPGVPADGARDVPDVSLFAGNGEFGVFYIVCQQDATNSPCALSPTVTTFKFVGLGGTSASSPAFAGIMALVNQQTGSRQGNANYVLYELAAKQTSSGCSATTGSGASCIFNDITLGSNAVPCKLGSTNCASSTTDYYYGVLSGYATTPGYDLATGLGSVNVANLVNGWKSAGLAPTSTNLQLSPLTSPHGTPVTAAISVSSSSGTPGGLVSLIGNTPNGAVGSASLSAGHASETVDNLPGGTYAVTAHYAGDASNAASDSSPVTVTITPEASIETIETKTFDTETGIVSSVSSAAYGSLFLIRGDVAGKSGHGIPTGAVTLTDNGASFDAGTYPLNNEGAAEDFSVILAAGQHNFAASYGGDPSFSSGSGSQTLTVTPMPMSCFYQSNTTILRPGWGLNLFLAAKATPVHAKDPFYIPNGTTPAPTGTIRLYEGTTQIGGPYSLTGVGGAILPSVSYSSYLVPEVYTTQAIASSQIQQPLGPITFVYSGDGNHASCTSQAIPLTWQTGPVPSNVNAYLQNYAYPFPQGTPAIFNVTIAAATPPPVYEPAFPVPTGAIQVSVDGTPTGTSVALGANGAALITVPTKGLSAGSHVFSFSYAGDSNYLTASAVSYTLNLAAPDFSLFAFPSVGTVVNGATSSAMTVQVTPFAGFTGSVSLSCSGLPRGAACNFAPAIASPGANASLTVTTTKASVVNGPGSHAAALPPDPLPSRDRIALLALVLLLPVTLRKRRPAALLSIAALAALPLLWSCGGSSSTPGPTSPAQPVASYINLSASTLSPVENASVTVTASLTGFSSSGSPSGSITFYTDGATTGASSPIASSGTTYTTTFATPGAHTISAAYAGDANYLASTAGPLRFQVAYASGTPPGSYTVTVVGTSGSLSHSTTALLVVQ